MEGWATVGEEGCWGGGAGCGGLQLLCDEMGQAILEGQIQQVLLHLCLSPVQRGRENGPGYITRAFQRCGPEIAERCISADAEEAHFPRDGWGGGECCCFLQPLG
ncbi:hypothetical protein AAFF_G00289580 [Aldrovandia affinis]|uniref:Uncharacterized protein n=1 Tax=Aldrovandia affinis TaxID=143900 RepID=A0AAD7W1H4_9TELE|nr:hypothetical protein AAFF_G00289580 [Aldrovandia affinis]